MQEIAISAAGQSLDNQQFLNASDREPESIGEFLIGKKHFSMFGFMKVYNRENTGQRYVRKSEIRYSPDHKRKGCN